MPPYMRDSPAWVTIESNCARCSGKNSLSTVALEAETQLCPEVYDGWLGFPTAVVVVIAGSTCHGRMSQYVCFASQQAMNASYTVALSRAYRWVASRSDRLC